jgi:hypothetical protein
MLQIVFEPYGKLHHVKVAVTPKAADEHFTYGFQTCPSLNEGENPGFI